MPTFLRTAVLRIGLSGLIAAVAIPAAPAIAQSWNRGWGNDWGNPASRFDRPSRISSRDRERDREGEVEVSRFVAEGDAAAALGEGAVKVVILSDDTARQPGTDAHDYSNAGAGDADYGPPAPATATPLPAAGDSAAFEAAVIDQLVKAGYNTNPSPDASGQVVELRIGRGVAEAPELPRKPVSGEMAVGVSNRGSMVGLGLNIDLTKPKKALLSTRLEARIRDAATGNILWEGRADILTRDGSSEWTGQAIAIRLSEALFDKFPGRNGENFSRR